MFKKQQASKQTLLNESEVFWGPISVLAIEGVSREFRRMATTNVVWEVSDVQEEGWQAVKSNEIMTDYLFNGNGCCFNFRKLNLPLHL